MALAQAQRQFLQSEGPKVVYGCLLNGLFLDGLLDLMDSEEFGFMDSKFGFIGKIRYKEDGMYLPMHVSTNVARDKRTKKFYRDNLVEGL